MNSIKCGLMVSWLAFSAACTQTDQEKARRDADEARVKARQEADEIGQEAKKAGREAKAEAQKLGNKMNEALEGGSAKAGGSEDSASVKLHRAGEKAGDAGNRAAVKLNNAALMAKVKTKLVNEVGLSTLTNIEVDTTGHVVTLTGAVRSEEQKHLAEIAAQQVDGVSKVVNHLAVHD